MADENNKEITNKDLANLIDKLAISTAKGFENIEKKMATKEDLTNGLNSLEEKLTGRIDGLERRIDDYAMNKVSYEKFDPLVKRVKVLEEKVGV